MTPELLAGIEGLEELAPKGLRAYVEFEEAFEAAFARCRRLRRPSREVAERAAGAARAVIELAPQLAAAVEPYRHDLRVCSTGVTNLRGFRAPSAAEAVVAATGQVAKQPEAWTRLPEVFPVVSRFRLAWWAWKFLLDRSAFWWTNAAECLDIELARLRERIESRSSPGAPSDDELNETETEIVQVVRKHGPILGKAIAVHVKKEFTGSFRDRLSGLVRRRYLTNGPKGYEAV